tara:strand:+ start:48 stop:1112 length:1065 start_codon:yes stop_codon:yes gene_type:complete
MVLPIAYGLGALALRGATMAAPYAVRGAMALGRGAKGIVKPSNIKSYFLGTGARTPTSGIGPVLPRSRPGLFKPSIKNIVGQSAAGYGGMLAYDALTDSAEQSVEDQKKETQRPPSDRQPGLFASEGDKKIKKKKKDDATDLDNKIKKGDLDDFIKERMDLFDKYLGSDKEQVKSGGFAALTEFGLNLASARGGNLMDKIARSAKDPLKTFTAIGMAAKDRADKIKMAAIESGIEAQEAALDRAGDTDGTTFQKNLATLKTMFTDKEGELTIPQEDLINMAKAGGTTSKKEFFASIIPQLMQTQDPLTMQVYDENQALSMAERMWSAISGQTQPSSSKKGESNTNTTGDPLGIM